MRLPRRNFLRLAAAAAMFPAGSWGARAQSWPSKPIRAITPGAAGAALDVVSRLVLAQLSVQLGQQIIVDNRGGAGGTIGVAAAAKADADGYTLLTHTATHAIAPAIYANLRYDAGRDFAAIAPFGQMPTVLVISPARGIRTVQEFVAAARANKGAFSFASAGTGSTTHLAAERFRISAGFEANHVPYKGGGYISDLLAGRIDYAFPPIGPVIASTREGRLLALAVSSRERASMLPDVPTTLESGFTASDYTLWFGMFAPVRTPREIVDRLHQETSKALLTANVRGRFAELGVEPMVMSPAEFDVYVREEIESHAALAKAAGLKPN